MPLKLTPIALICSALFVSGCSWDGGSSSSSDNPPVVEPPVNEAPVAGDQSGLTLEANATLDIDLSLYASDPDGDALTYSITIQPTNGALEDKGDGIFTYTPSADYEGTDTFTYQVNDGEFTDEGLITISVIPEGTGDKLINTVDKLNTAIAEAVEGDTIMLAAGGVFNEGVILLDKAVTLDGGNLAVISGSACIQVKAGGAAIKNLTLKNDFIGLTEDQDINEDFTGTCAISNSDGQTGAITIVPSLDAEAVDYADQLAALKPVMLENITFDASANTEQANYGNTKASWLTTFSLFELKDSKFVGLSTNVQNNGVFVNCSRSDEGRLGSKFLDNNFAIGTVGTKETAAIKVGDSSGGVIKGDATSANATCNLTLEGNNFDNYKQLQNQNAKTSDTVAIHSWESAINADYASTNTLNGQGGTEPDPDPVGGIDTVAKLNAAIAAATPGDTIELANGTFDAGVIELNKAVTIDGMDIASITGGACFKVSAGGATIQNLTFANDFIGLTQEQDDNKLYDGTCAITNSDGQVGAINILPSLSSSAEDYEAQLAALEPVVLQNLTFDASANDAQANYGTTKASWVTTFTLFELHDSEFIGLKNTVQNNGIFINCSKSDEARLGSLLDGNEFTLTGTGTKETAAVKIGDSSSGVIKGDAASENATCGVELTGNVFNNYIQLQNQNGKTSDTVAIHSWLSAINADYADVNTLNAPQ